MKESNDQEGSLSFAQLRARIEKHKADLEFGLARKLIEKNRPSPWPPEEEVWLDQQWAFCTYKDEDVLPAVRFKKALTILESIGLRDPDNTDPAKVPRHTLPETLALGGAVYKRMFEHGGLLENLHYALSFYRAAWKRNPKEDMGYGGVNAAFLLDLLAARLVSVADLTGNTSPEAERLREEAKSLRQAMAEQLPKFALEKENEAGAENVCRFADQYWYVATMAEIHLGLRNYDALADWLQKARNLTNVREWEKQTTFRQLLLLARTQGHAPPDEDQPSSTWKEPWKTLAGFFEKNGERAFSCWRGKVGLALSGGGFRASLFHLGVLARLAEMDVLRSVEVLSTVSGGSIVGAHYYLEVQRLLEKTPDTDIKREDYIEAVRRVQMKFLAGVQTNLRTRVLTDLFSNLRMLVPRWFGWLPYTRSHRIGELYEETLYASVEDGRAGDERRMPDLRIQPSTQNSHEFLKPKFSNWRRRAKVPVLLLNTTSLNSGHSWQFTASWMGEPPGLLGDSVDMNARYRRLYYDQARIEALKQYRLGHAVAASACVPGLFEPLEIKGLYPGRTVRLVDGGVHDNQGVGGLLDESCTFILCSDASGQMDDETSPSDGTLGVPLRSTSIQGDRVREAEYQDLKGRLENRALNGLFFIHLKEDLVPAAIDWVGCDDPTKEVTRDNTTYYEIDRDLQGKLAAMRTDLDSFTEVEAFSLMLSGYLMTEKQFERLNEEHLRHEREGTWGGFDISAPRGDWPFLPLEPIMGKGENSTDLRRRDLGLQLKVGSQLTFKVWRLYPLLSKTALALAGMAVVGSVWLAHEYWETTVNLGTWKMASLIVGTLLFVGGLAVPMLKWLNPRKAMRSWLLKFALAVLGWIVANFHVHTFDRIFLKRGKLDRLMNLPSD